jgi:hypothetical protein
MSERCAWRNDSGLPCRYPGTFSFSTKGTGPWYCAWHVNPSSVEHAAQVVLESQSYIPEDPAEARRIRQRLADAYVASIGLGRAEGEGASVYRARRQAWLRVKMALFGRGDWLPPADSDYDSASVREMKRILRARYKGEPDEQVHTNRAHNPGPPNWRDSTSGDKQAA